MLFLNLLSKEQVYNLLTISQSRKDQILLSLVGEKLKWVTERRMRMGWW